MTPDPNIERLREALLRNAEITEKAQVFMEDEDVEESREDVTLWRDAAAALAAVSADLERADRLRDDYSRLVHDAARCAADLERLRRDVERWRNRAESLEQR